MVQRGIIKREGRRGELGAMGREGEVEGEMRERAFGDWKGIEVS